MPEEQGGQPDGGTGTQGLGGGGGPSGPPRPTGDLDWRARALKAEARVQELEPLAAELAQSVEHLRAQLAGAERKRQIERALTDTGAVDVETASLLIENSLGTSQTPDVNGAIADLRRRKPFLFNSGPRASAMSSAIGAGAPAPLSAAADEARVTGDRNALMRYLRMKRG